MRVDSKVSLLMLLLTIIVIVASLCSIYLEDVTWAHIILSVFPAVSISVLVWERILEIANRRLEYVYENTLVKLHEMCSLEKSRSEYYPLDILEYSRDIQNLTEKVRRIGSFVLLIRLYPSDSITLLEETSIYLQKFNERVKDLHNFTNKKRTTYNEEVLAHFFGLKETDLTKQNPASTRQTKEFYGVLKKEKPELIEEICGLWRTLNMPERMETILRHLETFMEENSLPIPQRKRVRVQHIGFN